MFGSKENREEQVTDPAALGPGWTPAHNKVMGLNLNAKNASFLGGLCSKVCCSASLDQIIKIT